MGTGKGRTTVNNNQKWYQPTTAVDDADLGDLSAHGFVRGVDFGLGATRAERV